MKKFKYSFGPDSFMVETTDADPYFAEARAKMNAEVQAAIDRVRAAGDSRPVAFQLIGDSPAARKLLPLLPPGIPTVPSGGTLHVVSREQARHALRGVSLVLRLKAAKLFRKDIPSKHDPWPVCHWTVDVRLGAVQWWQTRTLRDERGSQVDRTYTVVPGKQRMKPKEDNK